MRKESNGKVGFDDVIIIIIITKITKLLFVQKMLAFNVKQRRWWYTQKPPVLKRMVQQFAIR
jgi:hypothetical protein